MLFTLNLSSQSQPPASMVTILTISFTCLLIIIYLCYKYLTWHYGLWKNLGLPGPKPRIIYGNFPSIITGKQPLVYDVDEIYNAFKKSNRAIGVFMTRNPEILLLDPKLAHRLLVTDFSKFRDNLSSAYVLNKSYDIYAARNPFFVTGNSWKEKRADAMAGLTVSRLNAAYPIWKNTGLKLREYLRKKIISRSVTIIDTKDLATRFTVDILGDFLWGIDSEVFKMDSYKDNQLLEKCSKMLKQAAIAEGLYSKLNLVPFLKILFPKSRVFPIETDRFFSSLTKHTLKMRSNNSKTTNPDRMDFLNHIRNLQERKNISHDDVMGHILTIVLDGYETAAIVIYHTLFYLAKYPRVQEKLRDEIRTNLEEDGFMTFEVLNGLPYLDQCVYETVRMITPLPKISRICTEATELEIDDVTKIPIKPGMILTIPVFSYHHDEEYFPNSYEYNPDRFDNGTHAELTKRGILLPFGDGPRICLGLRLALLEVKACIVEIIKDYELKCTPETVEEKKPDGRSFIFGLEGNFSLNFQCLES